MYLYDSWRGRNAKNHGRPHRMPISMAAGIIEAINRRGTFFDKEHWNTAQPPGLIHTLSWCPPHNWLKVNVDGALLQTNSGGTGLVIWNNKGNPIMAAGWTIEHWDNTQVEIQAISQINQVLQDSMYDLMGIIVEGDNISVIKLMQDFIDKRKWMAQPQLGAEINWTQLFHKVVFQHTPPRRFNRAAHFYAHRAIHWSREGQSFLHIVKYYARLPSMMNIKHVMPRKKCVEVSITNGG
ncbi:hypothetical protein M5K25_013040 [Dendrobium thyrsiflorum]|uniref:RNase H type-1 domain-containing protein n=1 Tax=Dendrobium thyrsiflorum TaxID=117978 RepID=A0ABD0V5Q6_DENTH